MEIKPAIRYAKDMEDVLLSKNINKEEELYYMFRGVDKKEDIRYDVTEIPGKLIGEEFVKTKGHYHDDYQEIYIVLEGEAIFLMQKGKDIIEDIYFVHAKKNDVILIPFEYGHITINPTKNTLKLGNFVHNDCGHDYDSIANKSGAAYFYTIKGWIKNSNYSKIPEIIEKKPLPSIPSNINEICQKKA
ncbi:MAG TPA: glucose-6-phosphate isomerase family protein [Candidatus Pacearchaeota archaeon]|nr:glucose-6-phosphate isomerase family protein [Candidatus Pacearchaeota archaeon]